MGRTDVIDAVALARDMTPHQMIEQLESDLGVGAADLAHAMGASLRTIERWRNGVAYPQTEARQRLATLFLLRNHLLDTFAGRDAVHQWLRAENRYLGGLAPIDALRAGRADRVEAALEALDSGVFV